MAKTIATIIGIAFILVGLAGFVAPGVAGFHLSLAHNLIHLVSGAVSLYFGLKGTLAGARTFSFVFGIVYGLLGVAGFVLGAPGTPAMPGMAHDDQLLSVIPGVLELGTSDHMLHIAIGIVFVTAALRTKATTHGIP